MDVLSGLASVLQPGNFALLVTGVAIGLVFGTVPGLSGITAVALLVPFSYVLGPEASIIMMIGVYVATCMAGALAATLFNMPGDVMGAATARDGYPLTQKGMAARAISVAITSSSVGTLIGSILLIVLTPIFLMIALNFGPPEYFALTMLGMTCVASLSTGSLPKALIAAVVGLLLATVGFDPVSGAGRFLFGIQQLQGGIDFIPAIIGFFALSEILQSLYKGTMSSTYKASDIKKLPRFTLPSLADLKYVMWTIPRQAVIGTFIGILPGAGSTIAAFVGYGTEVQFNRGRGEFGKGELRGVSAPEAANNGAAAGSMVPLLTLGIPGGAVTAIMLGVFVLNGLRPGPLLFRDSPEISAAVAASLLVASVVVFIVGLLLVRSLLRLLLVPYPLFATIVMILAVVGSFSIANRPIDIWVMVFCGVLGFFAKQYDFPIAALVLGLVLGDIAETNLVNGIGVTRGDWGLFFTRPITMGTLAVALVLLLLPLLWWQLDKRRKSTSVDEPSR